LEIEALKPREKPYKEADGDSLFVLVQPSGGKLWQGAYRFEGKQKTFSIGPVRKIGPAEARRKWAEARDLLDSGVDPMAAKGEAKAARKAAAAAPVIAVKTFGMACDEWFERRKASGSAAKTLKGYVDKIGHLKRAAFAGKAAADIEAEEVLDFLRGFERLKQFETRDRVRRLGAEIFACATFGKAGNGKANPFDIPDNMLLKKVRGNRPAFTEEADLARLFKAMAVDRTDKGTSEAITLALQMLALTAVRPGELCGMEWSEISLDKARWTIPAERMKMKREHIVPLSRQAIAILRKMEGMTGGARYVFSTNGGAKPIEGHGLGKRLRFLGFDTGREHCPHGFRSSFSTTMNGVMDAEHNKVFPADVIEVQLAHITGGVAGIYKRENGLTYYAARARLMQAWADKIDALATS
jgi:integrase